MKKILIIDNDKDFVGILSRNLKNKGYDVSWAQDGRLGIKKAKLERPDLIILEAMLAETAGYSISRLLKFDMKHKNTPIIAFTSSREGAALSESKVGADAYIAKSSDAKEVFEKIEDLLKEKAAKRLDIQVEYPPMPFLEKAKEIADVGIDGLRSRIKRLAAINEAIYDINRCAEIDICMKRLIEKASAILTAEIISLMFLDRKKNELVVKMAKGLNDEIINNAKAKLGEGVSGWVAKEGKPLLVMDVNKYPHLQPKDDRKYKTGSFISVPLKVGGEILGVVNVTDKADRTSFTEEDLDTLVAIADNAAVSIKKSALYEELKRMNKVKSEFLAILSHELKNPLTNVKASVDLLLENSRNVFDAEHIQFLNIAKRNIERLLRLINDLLDVSKLESGKISMRRDKFDISNLMRDVSALFRAAFDGKSINFILRAQPEEKVIWGDSDKLEQVLNNLFSNAVKFTPQGGTIELSLEDRGEAVRFVVSDTGPGISKEDMPKVFDRFSSLSAGKSRALEGTGLGLSITKDIIEMHKGSIWVESELGKGTKFFVEIPKDLRKG